MSLYSCCVHALQLPEQFCSRTSPSSAHCPKVGCLSASSLQTLQKISPQTPDSLFWAPRSAPPAVQHGHSSISPGCCESSSSACQVREMLTHIHTHDQACGEGQLHILSCCCRQHITTHMHSCRSSQDQLAFALHAAVLASGYRLVAVGEQAQLEGAAQVVLVVWCHACRHSGLSISWASHGSMIDHDSRNAGVCIHSCMRD